MNGELRQASAPVDDSSGSRRQAAVVTLLAVVLCVVAVRVSRPHVEEWLQVRAAYTQLWDSNWNERHDAFQWLLRHGEDPDAELLEMLQHPSQGYRLFAAEKLSSRPPKREITAAFLHLLEDDDYLEQFDGPVARYNFRRDAIRGLGTHAESVVGPLSDTDEKIVSLLRPMVSTPYRLDAEAAQVLAEYLPRRPELAESLRPYSRNGYLYGSMKVARGFYRSDPAELPTYVDLLLEGLSSDGFNRQRACGYLKELGPQAEIAVARLQALKSSSPQLAAVVEQILSAIRGEPDERE